MQIRKIGSLEVSAIALGCHDLGSQLDDQLSVEIVHAALDAGITFFDTAADYGEGRSEEVLGKALAGRREDVIVGTKFQGPPEGARASLEGSLKRLGMDHVDILTQHFPVPAVPFDETLETLAVLVGEGKVRELGVSNLNAEQLSEAVAAGNGTSRFASVQNGYNLIDRKAEFEVLPACVASGMAFVGYFPLYHGLLTGTFRRNQEPDSSTRLGQDTDKRKAAVMTEGHFDVVEGLVTVADKVGHSVLELSLARLLAQPGVAAIAVGAWSTDQARENAATGSLTLTAEEVAEIDRVAPSDPHEPDTPSSRTGQ